MGLRVIRAANPAPLTLDGTRTYVVGRERAAIVDPGPELEEHIDAVAESIGGGVVVSILLTHDHPDHADGAASLAARVHAPVLRLGAVFIVAGFVATSIAREKDDRVRDVLLALPVTRAQFAWARLAGFTAVAWCIALLCGAVALAFAAPGQALPWAFTLGCELSIVAAFALFAATGLANVVAAGVLPR